MVVGTVLGVIGLVVFSLLLESFGYTALSVVATAGALAIGVYAIKSKYESVVTPPVKSGTPLLRQLAANYLAFVQLASIRLWLRVNESTPAWLWFRVRISDLPRK